MKKVIIASLITAALIDLALCITIGLPYIIACIVADIIAGIVITNRHKIGAIIYLIYQRKHSII